MQFGSKPQSNKWQILWVTAKQKSCRPESRCSQWESAQQNLESSIDFRIGTYIRSTVQKLFWQLNSDILIWTSIPCYISWEKDTRTVGPNAQEHTQKSLKWALKNSEHKTEVEWIQINSFQPKNFKCSTLNRTECVLICSGKWENTRTKMLSLIYIKSSPLSPPSPVLELQ